MKLISNEMGKKGISSLDTYFFVKLIVSCHEEL